MHKNTSICRWLHFPEVSKLNQNSCQNSSYRTPHLNRVPSYAHRLTRRWRRQCLMMMTWMQETDRAVRRRRSLSQWTQHFRFYRRTNPIHYYLTHDVTPSQLHESDNFGCVRRAGMHTNNNLFRVVMFRFLHATTNVPFIVFVLFYL